MSKIILLAVALVVGFTGFNLWQNKQVNDAPKRSAINSVHQFPIDKADSWWVVINKNRPLEPQTYVPSDLVVPEIPLRSNITDEESKLTYATADAFNKMADAAKKDGITLTFESGYRSYDLQKRLYEYYAAQQVEADSYSAKPGYSEHQTGLAVDVGSASNASCNVKPCFADTQEAVWLKENAHEYGFIIRYPEGKQDITGYKYEPWHLRYTGIYLAAQMKDKNLNTLEEYFKLDSR